MSLFVLFFPSPIAYRGLKMMDSSACCCDVNTADMYRKPCTEKTERKCYPRASTSPSQLDSILQLDSISRKGGMHSGCFFLSCFPKTPAQGQASYLKVMAGSLFKRTTTSKMVQPQKENYHFITNVFKIFQIPFF